MRKLVFHDLTLGEVIQEKPSKKLLQIAETQMIYEAIKVMDDNKVGKKQKHLQIWCA